MAVDPELADELKELADQDPGAAARLRWRLETDLHPTHPRTNQLTPAEHALCPLGEHCTGGLDHIDWDIWAIVAGRGFGKTRSGAEDVAEYGRQNPGARIALVGHTTSDARDVMVEGESGLLAVMPEVLLRGGDRTKAWNRSLGQLHLANGSRYDTYSAERPDQLRGPQHHRAWVDEPAKFRDAHLGDAVDTTWSNLILGLRLGKDPKLVVTGTPKPSKLMKLILAGRRTVMVTGSTYENAHNLAPAFRRRIIEMYEGTRLGAQELYARMLEDVVGALWDREKLDRVRDSAPPLEKVVVAVDPAITSSDESDETGIIVVGRATVDEKRHGYVLADLSIRDSPARWGKRVIQAALDYDADEIVYEKNQGGDMVTHVLMSAAEAMGVECPKLNGVTATRGNGKKSRAEPVAALYEQQRVHHPWSYADLEDQMCTWVPDDPKSKSPDRIDALVYGIVALDLLILNTGRRKLSFDMGPDAYGLDGDVLEIDELAMYFKGMVGSGG